MKKFFSVFGLFFLLTLINYCLCSLLAWSFITTEWESGKGAFTLFEIGIAIYTIYYADTYRE